jgi:hypothetical protein
MKWNVKYGNNGFIFRPIDSSGETKRQEQDVIFSVRALPLLLSINCRPTPPVAGAAGQSIIVPA